VKSLLAAFQKACWEERGKRLYTKAGVRDLALGPAARVGVMMNTRLELLC
jgi:hypothetical protein